MTFPVFKLGIEMTGPLRDRVIGFGVVRARGLVYRPYDCGGAGSRMGCIFLREASATRCA